jgi:hypothetical protein
MLSELATTLERNLVMKVVGEVDKLKTRFASFKRIWGSLPSWKKDSGKP